MSSFDDPTLEIRVDADFSAYDREVARREQEQRTVRQLVPPPPTAGALPAPGQGAATFATERPGLPPPQLIPVGGAPAGTVAAGGLSAAEVATRRLDAFERAQQAADRLADAMNRKARLLEQGATRTPPEFATETPLERGFPSDQELQARIDRAKQYRRSLQEEVRRISEDVSAATNAAEVPPQARPVIRRAAAEIEPSLPTPASEPPRRSLAEFRNLIEESRARIAAQRALAQEAVAVPQPVPVSVPVPAATATVAQRPQQPQPLPAPAELVKGQVDLRPVQESTNELRDTLEDRIQTLRRQSFNLPRRPLDEARPEPTQQAAPDLGVEAIDRVIEKHVRGTIELQPAAQAAQGLQRALENKAAEIERQPVPVVRPIEPPKIEVRGGLDLRDAQTAADRLSQTLTEKNRIADRALTAATLALPAPATPSQQRPVETPTRAGLAPPVRAVPVESPPELPTVPPPVLAPPPPAPLPTLPEAQPVFQPPPLIVRGDLDLRPAQDATDRFSESLAEQQRQVERASAIAALPPPPPKTLAPVTQNEPAPQEQAEGLLAVRIRGDVDLRPANQAGDRLRRALEQQAAAVERAAGQAALITPPPPPTPQPAFRALPEPVQLPPGPPPVSQPQPVEAAAISAAGDASAAALRARLSQETRRRQEEASRAVEDEVRQAEQPVRQRRALPPPAALARGIGGDRGSPAPEVVEIPDRLPPPANLPPPPGSTGGGGFALPPPGGRTPPPTPGRTPPPPPPPGGGGPTPPGGRIPQYIITIGVPQIVETALRLYSDSVDASIREAATPANTKQALDNILTRRHSAEQAGRTIWFGGSLGVAIRGAFDRAVGNETEVTLDIQKQAIEAQESHRRFISERAQSIAHLQAAAQAASLGPSYESETLIIQDDLKTSTEKAQAARLKEADLLKDRFDKEKGDVITRHTPGFLRQFFGPTKEQEAEEARALQKDLDEVEARRKDARDLNDAQFQRETEAQQRIANARLAALNRRRVTNQITIESTTSQIQLQSANQVQEAELNRITSESTVQFINAPREDRGRTLAQGAARVANFFANLHRQNTYAAEDLESATRQIDLTTQLRPFDAAREAAKQETVQRLRENFSFDPNTFAGRILNRLTGADRRTAAIQAEGAARLAAIDVQERRAIQFAQEDVNADINARRLERLGLQFDAQRSRIRTQARRQLRELNASDPRREAIVRDQNDALSTVDVLEARQNFAATVLSRARATAATFRGARNPLQAQLSEIMGEIFADLPTLNFNNVRNKLRDYGTRIREFYIQAGQQANDAAQDLTSETAAIKLETQGDHLGAALQRIEANRVAALRPFEGVPKGVFSFIDRFRDSINARAQAESDQAKTRDRQQDELTRFSLNARGQEIASLRRQDPVGAEIIATQARAREEAFNFAINNKPEFARKTLTNAIDELNLQRENYLRAFEGRELDLRVIRLNPLRDTQSPGTVLQEFRDALTELQKKVEDGVKNGFKDAMTD